jgi:hypothetical protein
VGSAIGQVLPLAIGVALSPIPIIAVVLMLVTPRARTNGPAFVLGWLVGLGGVGAIVLGVANPAGASDDGQPATGASVLKLALGVLLLAAALREWRRRPRGEEEPPMPKWMGALDAFGPGKAAGAGVLLSGLNPKNLVLAAGAAAAIAGTGIPTGQQVVAYAVFAVIGTLGVGAPVAIYFAMGARSRELLESLKAWMAHYNAAIMATLLLIIGAKLIGDGISGLS